ncbi:MAG: MBL fold metallo-hydrolase [Notoacmeibacter sp.]|nr:MBL fold metallo-hydrolase [Notoacmeibacter sp.]
MILTGRHLRAAALVALAGLAAGCTATARNSARPVAIQPVKAIGIAATAAASVLRLHPEQGGPAVRALSRKPGNPTLTWLGHSTFLIRTAGRVVITDPNVSARVGIKFPLKPVRISPPPSGWDRLKRLDAVVISHIDHDHFDLPTLRALAARFPDAALFMPAGTQRMGARAGFTTIRTVQVWQTEALGPLRLTALPARHYGRRDVVGFNRSTAVGWEITGAGRKVFFSGDTGWSNHFAEIRKRRGRYPVALVPIGAYAPENLFADVHINPEDALKAASVLGARVAIAHHWGTYNLGAEKPAEARARFLAARASGVTPRVLDIGETISLK